MKQARRSKSSCKVASLAAGGLVLAALAALAAPAAAQSPAKLVPSFSQANDQVGASVAVSGETLVLGVPGDDNAGGVSAGSAAVFVRNGGTWSLQATLLPPDPASQRAFGTAAALSGDTAVVTSVGDDFAAGSQGGAVHVYARSGTSWIHEAELTASPSKPFDTWGWAVALQGDTLVLTSIGANAQQGAAYVFEREAAGWLMRAELVADDAEPNEWFGWVVSLAGDTVVVGAPHDADSGPAAGAAYVFKRTGSTWAQQGKLLASDGTQADEFGTCVAIAGDTIVVGAWHDHIGDETQAGSAYVFVRGEGQWSQQAKLVASDATHADFFGSAVTLVGDAAVVTASRDDDVSGDAGSAYPFVRSGTAWTEQPKITAPPVTANAHFGLRAAQSGATVVFGAPSDGSFPSQGVGAGYVFDLPGLPWTDLGFGLAGVEGIPALTGSGSLEAGSAGSLSLALGKPSAPSLLLVSLASTPAPFKGGALHALPAIVQLPLATSADGGWSLAWGSWPSGIPAGSKLYFEVAVSDAAAVQGVSISNLLRATQP